MLEDASRLFERVKSETDNVDLAKQALNMEALCQLTLGNPSEVLNLLGEPDFSMTSTEPLLASAYHFLGNKKEAKSILQVGIFQHTVVLINLLSIYLGLCLDRKEVFEETARRSHAITEAFDLEKLHPGIILPLYFTLAQGYMKLGNSEKALELRPDVILRDLVMEEMDGIDSTKAILKDWPEAKIIIVTSFIDDEKVYPAIEAGAAGYLLKTSTAHEIADAIRATYRGERVLEPEVTHKMMERLTKKQEPVLHEDLTNREHEILMLIAQGKSNQEIADELFITLKTVKTHVSNILAKLDVDDRTQAAIYAFQHGLAK